MPFAAALSTADYASRAAEEVAHNVRNQLSRIPDLAAVFYSPHHAAVAAEIVEKLHEHLEAKTLIGVLGESVIAGSKEIEDRPAVALWAGAWDSPISIDPFHLVLEQTPDGPTLLGWPDSMLEANAADSLLLCFGDPYTFPVADLFLARMNEDHPGLPVAGGMASSPTGASAPALILNDEVKEQGAVGVLIRGAKFTTVVSQGCRPIGRPLVITKGQDNVIAELGGQTPLEYLRQLIDEVPANDKILMQRGLLIGLAISEYRDEFRPGDFLIRNLIGLDPRTGALAVTDRIRLGQTVQFQIRDAATADEDLKEILRSS